MGKDLSDTINKILENKKIINFLKKEEENKGFLLGKIEYFDDINVLIMYGITLDKKDKSKLKIFSYKLWPLWGEKDYEFKLGDFLPQIPEFATYPSINEIKDKLQNILKNPKSSLIDYSPFLEIINENK